MRFLGGIVKLTHYQFVVLADASGAGRVPLLRRATLAMGIGAGLPRA